MAFNAMKLRMALKDESEHQDDENYLVDVSDVFTRGILRDMGIEHEMFGGYGKLQSCSAARAILWTHLRETDRHRQLPLDVGVHTYRFRRAEVNHGLRFGDVYKGKVRVGVDRTPNFQNTPSEKLDVVLYDAEMKVLAKIASYDWAAGDIRTHIGDVSENAILFCDAGGYHNYEFLYLAVVWYSDLHPYRFSPFRFETVYRSNYFIKVDAPEALSDLMVGESFDAEMMDGYDGFGLTRSGRNYKFAEAPSSFGQSLSELIRTGYHDTAVRCIAHGAVSDGETFIDIEAGTKMVGAAQEFARKMVRDNMPEKLNCGRNDLTAMLYQSAFVYYLGGFVWNVVNDEVNGLLDLLPFIWNDDNDSSIRNWMRFNELRGKIYDTNNGGSHDEYLEMCDALAQSVGAERSMFLSRFKRNDPCPCGSGKKLKSHISAMQFTSGFHHEPRKGRVP